jgi:predicted transcriptional regulator
VVETNVALSVPIVTRALEDPSSMTPVDTDILRLLENGSNDELVLTPGVIAANTDWQRQTVREHLRFLSDSELVEYHEESRALYTLSERGRDFLNDGTDLDVADAE